jgi:2-keto-4-pentenoate hydratase/2-oxohepta-3-ene-1,7-dioic acid hydratase in catechol pathway
MKLMRVGAPGQERPAVCMADGSVIDVSSVVNEYDGAWLAAGGMAALEARLKEGVDGFPSVDINAERIGAPIVRPGHILAIGLNYADHAAEAGMDVPSEPILFTKAPSSYCGPNDTVIIPRTSVKTDWEVELGVVIGKEASYIADEAAAMEYVAGYCVVNDVSERDFQINRGPTWVKGKSAKTFCPTGPWLVSRDEIPDPQALPMKLSVNGQSCQDGNTSTMIFGVAHLVWYLSQFMVLEAGDLIATGTPPGVGMGMKPPKFLAAGDVMELEIEGLGKQRQGLAQA